MCRCGAKQDDRPGRKNRLGKKVIAKVIPAFPLSKIAHWSILLRGNGWSPRHCRSGAPDPILSTQRNSARPRSDFLYTKNVPPPRADFLYTHFFSGPLWDFVNERRRLYIGKNFPAARAKWLNLNKFDTNEIFPLRGLKRYEILEEKGICIQKISPLRGLNGLEIR